VNELIPRNRIQAAVASAHLRAIAAAGNLAAHVPREQYRCDHRDHPEEEDRQPVPGLLVLGALQLSLEDLERVSYTK